MKSEPCEKPERAVRRILAELMKSIEFSSDRILLGADPEDVHDLRVATRKTRVLLGRGSGVFCSPAHREFLEDLKRIGRCTGRCRELDVWLEAIAANREKSGIAEMEALEQVVRFSRDVARLRLSAELRAKWFQNLRVHAGKCQESPAPEEVLKPVLPMVAKRILKVHRRILRYGRALSASSAVGEFHRLRIEGKKLRYLLEFFGGFFDQPGSRKIIGDLKQLQDALGGINDRESQLSALDALPEKPRISVAVIEEHHRFLKEDLIGFHVDFRRCFDAFDSPVVDEVFSSLFRSRSMSRGADSEADMCR